MRRLPLLVVLISAAGLVALFVIAADGGRDGRDRLIRAADAMEHLRGVRFSLVASSVASGAGSFGGPLELTYRATGELVPPDRLRLVVTEPTPATLEIAGQRVQLDGQPASAAALRTLASPIALLEQLREPGTVTFSGPGLAPWTVTARYTVDRADRGVIEVECGLFDDLVRRQTFTVSQEGPEDGSGLTAVRTRYVVEYRDHGVDLGLPAQ